MHGHHGKIAGLLAMLLALPVAGAIAQPADQGCTSAASDAWPITRIAGTDRYATAVCASTAGFPDGGVDTVVIARGDAAGGFADALAGTVLAQAVGGPVLLTRPGALPGAVANEITRLGADTALVLGGTAAVSPAVVRQLQARVGTVERVHGPDRAGTAAAIAARVGGTDAFVVNGHAPADALTAGAAAARSGAVLLLTGRDHLPDATAQALEGRTRATIVGGPGVVGDPVDGALRDLGLHVRRLGGATRYETGATVARVHPGDRTIHLVGGADTNLVDAIAAGWLAARADGGPVVYTRPDRIGPGTGRWLRLGGLAGAPPTRIVGGTASVGDPVPAQLDQWYAEADAGGRPPQLRAMWAHLFDDSLKTRAGIEQVLSAATTANLNTIIVQATRRHDAFYDSDVLPATSDPDLQEGLDLLAELVPAAHARGLEVHAWFSVMPSFHTSMVDEADRLGPDHVWTRHGPHSDDPWMATGNTAYYDFLDPAIPGVQDHVVDTVVEVARRYDVDGIHLDYLRYECLQPVEPGTCAGATFGVDATHNQHPTTMARFDDHARGRGLGDFLRDQVTDVVRRITVEVADVDPSVEISAALIAQGAGPQGPDLAASFEDTKAYWNKGQDWPSWVSEGLVDVALPMAYFREADANWRQAYDDWITFADTLDTDEVVFSAGQGSYLNCLDESVSQLVQSITALDGAGIYSYQGDVAPNCPTAGGSLLRHLGSDGPFAAPAPAPQLERRARPTQGHVLVGANDGDVVTVTPVLGSGTVERIADATGHAAFPWLAPGAYEVVRNGASTIAEVTAGGVTRVDAP